VLVGVVGGDVLGDCDQVGEAVARKRREVVAGERGGLVRAGLVGGRVAALAGLVDGEADDDRGQKLLGGDGERVGDAAGAEDAQDAVGVARRSGPSGCARWRGG
jgi:hypothetical protein